MSKKKEYYILTDSKEEFEELEKVYNQFKENYVILLTGPTLAQSDKMVVGRLIIRDDSDLLKSELKKRNLKKYIQIYPGEKYNRVEKIIAKDSKLEKNIKEKNLGWIMRIENCALFIEKRNPYD